MVVVFVIVYFVPFSRVYNSVFLLQPQCMLSILPLLSLTWALYVSVGHCMHLLGTLWSLTWAINWGKSNSPFRLAIRNALNCGSEMFVNITVITAYSHLTI